MIRLFWLLRWVVLSRGSKSLQRRLYFLSIQEIANFYSPDKYHYCMKIIKRCRGAIDVDFDHYFISGLFFVRRILTWLWILFYANFTCRSVTLLFTYAYDNDTYRNRSDKISIMCPHPDVNRVIYSSLLYISNIRNACNNN
jgi:hypothetical protein